VAVDWDGAEEVSRANDRLFQTQTNSTTGALGIKLATDKLTGKKFVCQIVGDGTFLFSVPGSVYWIARRYNIPILTIVLNNKGMYSPLY